MNYRHAYHAGNFADVFKHLVLVRIVEYLKRKEAAFRVIDTHAGRGNYNLGGIEAGKTSEWIEGIGRLLANRPGGEAGKLLEAYFSAIQVDDGPLEHYPGSPLIVRRLLRKQDRLSACELHPVDHEALGALFAGDWQVRVNHLDGWLAAGAHLPPKEKRGLVLIDPPFEKEGEFERLADALEKGDRRWPGGIYMLWYPVKAGNDREAFIEFLRSSGISDLARIELSVREGDDGPGLSGSGLIVRNPPFKLEAEMEVVLPALCSVLGDGQKGSWLYERLTAE
ncbi:MAG: 23S rRNA (adenine(2030)-N(6))-methyltransferase RlmJ [Rhizobiaceae bacterium]